jgi:hypothetical protein
VCGQAAPRASAATTPLGVAEILREFAPALSSLTAEQARVVRDLVDCRTAVFGGTVQQCDHCGHREVVYHSCGNRHCPRCQCLSQARWLEAQQQHLLPVEYFHVVFTVPEALHPLFRARPEVVYKLLFQAVSETLKEVALNPERLGARLGFTAVLHTWTQTLLYHPHIHCIVAGGGLSADGTEWVSCKPGFFLPVKVLSKVFRGKLLAKLEKVIAKGELTFDPKQAKTLLQKSARKPWVVYSKRPFAGPQQVLDYLGRYTHRVAISNHRLVSVAGGKVTFRYKDRAHGDKQRTMTVSGEEFVRRFLLHVLPSGFVKTRHYGFLANAVRDKSLALCRELLDTRGQAGAPLPAAESWQDLLYRLTGEDVTLCPSCQIGHLFTLYQIPGPRGPWSLRGRATSP